MGVNSQKNILLFGCSPFFSYICISYTGIPNLVLHPKANINKNFL